MSYVIQNFYQPNQNIVFNNRFKLLLKCKNILKIFLYFRFFLFFKFTSIFLIIDQSYALRTYKSLFYSNFYVIDSKFYIKKGTNYLTKSHKRISFYGLFSLNKILDNKTFSLLSFGCSNKLINNSYFFSTKVFFFSLALKTYKPLFMYFFLNHSMIWTSYSIFLRFNNNFLFYFYFLRINYFINNRFFKIFNH